MSIVITSGPVCRHITNFHYDADGFFYSADVKFVVWCFGSLRIII